MKVVEETQTGGQRQSQLEKVNFSVVGATRPTNNR